MQLARIAGFWLVSVEEPGIVRVRGKLLEIGPGASKDRVITAACHRALNDDGISRGERCLRLFVAALGAKYDPADGAESVMNSVA